MKLISVITLLATVSCQKIQHEPFPFPPQFQTPSSAMFSSDNSIYLPPESHTPIPYYALNNMNKLPYQFLPPTGTKAPSIFSSPFPIMVSSTYKNIMEDGDNDSQYEESNNRRMVVMRPASQKNTNQTVNQLEDKREAKTNTRMPNFQTSFEKFDHKPNSAAGPIQKPAARRMIITSEIQRSDSINDQVKAPSFQNTQFIQPPGVFISSSTEPSIPILRLSNEMDLDGSFSYEALGADQTHYVQHSRMENMGTDKEEQVVEGSYSYVGDDGRTYTVHYVADSNGYRATGDHLPVPPPVPEIIQRAVQYNLAEEARKPPHLKSSWDDYETNYREESREESKQRIFNVPPPRSLFTGKTPEAFSFGFSQGTNLQNNLATAASFQVPTKTNYDITIDQSKPKPNATPISPQITFLASQGAHNPSMQAQTSPSKPTNTEKSSLPSLMNYEADMKETEQEANKALWRWQYGLNSNTNQTPNKNSISRSSSEGDDIVINFNDMSPEQYTNMMQSQIFDHSIESDHVEINNNKQFSTPYSQTIDSYPNKDIKYPEINTNTVKYDFLASTEKNDYYSNPNDLKQNTDIYSKIISSHNFIPRSQIATQSYNVEVSSYEPTQINLLNDNYTQNQNAEYKTDSFNNKYIIIDNIQQRTTTTVEPVSNTINIVEEFIPKVDDKESFKPSMVFNNENNSYNKQETETTALPMKAKIKDNIFLKHLFKESDDEEKNIKQDVKEEDKNQNDIISEPRIEKEPKFIGFQQKTQNIEFQQKPQNEIKMLPPKPLDMSDVLNYVIMKNHFESIKTRPKSKPAFNQNTNVKEPSVHYIPIKEDKDERESFRQEQNNDYQPLNREQQQELRGLIKNYKVLQRNKNTGPKIQSIPEPQRHIKAFHTPGLPPLGRAGPSLKSYLPPAYV